MQLTTDTLPEYFAIASPHNSHYATETNTFDFVSRDSHSLLVTIGESWTWGSELQNRLHDVYGNLVSTALEWDWLNLAIPGASNFFIAEKAEELHNIVDNLDYQKIVVVCLFTELGRDFNSQRDIHIDYVSWFRDNIDQPEDFYKFLTMLNQNCADRILSLRRKNVTIVFGSNFVDNIGLPADQTLPLPWFRLLNIPCSVTAYAGTTGVKRLKDIEQFLTADKQLYFKSWYSELITDSEYVDTACQQISQGKTFSHPDKSGHSVWAKYIIDRITQ